MHPIDPSDERWADALHATVLDLVTLFNRPEPDAALLLEAGVHLDRALFPLLVRLGRHAPVGVVELSLAAGKDHSTVSRQVAKLEKLGLVERTLAEADQRVRLLVPTAAGEAVLERLRIARRTLIQRWFGDWAPDDRAQLLTLLQRAVQVTEHETMDPANAPVEDRA